MGLNFVVSRSSGCDTPRGSTLERLLARLESKVEPKLPNPNPQNYQILRGDTCHGYLILMLRYPDCTNYEGVKILVFDKGISLSALHAQGWIDPHFDSKLIHPIARFVPTEEGWDMAVTFCKAVVSR